MSIPMLIVVIVVVLFVILGNIMLLRKNTRFNFDKEKFEARKQQEKQQKPKGFEDEEDW